MDVDAWLQAWVRRRPLKEPPAVDGVHYTAEVMARVRALNTPSAQPIAPAARALRLSWWSWPRLTVGGLAAVAVGVAVILWDVHRASPRQALRIAQDAQVLEALGDPTIEWLGEGRDEELADELQTTDQLMVIAKSVPDKELSVDQTLQLLQQLGEEAPDHLSTGSTGSNDEELLEELKLFDETDLVTTS